MNKTRQWLAPIGLWVLAAILTICGGILFSGCTDDNDNPVVNPEFTTLKEALQGIDRISDIKENPDTAAIRKKSEGLLDQHKDELMENWERMENGETLAKINPLD